MSLLAFQNQAEIRLYLYVYSFVNTSLCIHCACKNIIVNSSAFANQLPRATSGFTYTTLFFDNTVAAPKNNANRLA